MTKFKRYIREFVYDLKEVKNGKKKKNWKHEAIINCKENRKLHKKENKILGHHVVQV